MSLANDDHSKLEENVQVSQRFMENLSDVEAWVDAAMTQYIDDCRTLRTKQELEDVQAKFEVWSLLGVQYTSEHCLKRMYMYV